MEFPTPVNEMVRETAEPATATPVGATGVPRVVCETVIVAIPSEVTVAVVLSDLVFKIITRYFFPLSPPDKVPVV